MTFGVKMAENAIFVVFVSVIGVEWLISLNITDDTRCMDKQNSEINKVQNMALGKLGIKELNDITFGACSYTIYCKFNTVYF